MLNVIKVITDTLEQVGIASEAVHLGPTGQAGFYRMANIVMRNLVLEVLNQLRSFRSRPDQAHFSFEHIPELRSFIDIPLPHECANPKPARGVFPGPANLA